MGKFIVLYIGGTYPENEEDTQKVMDAWGAWYGSMGEAIVDGGNPFGASKSVTEAGVVDGPLGSHPATGYTAIAAESLDDAVAKVENHPHLSFGGSISVFEAIDMG